MSNIAQILPANGVARFKGFGRFVRLMASTGRVEFVFYLRGSEIARSGSVGAGYAERFPDGFDEFEVQDETAAINSIELLTRERSEVFYDSAVVTLANQLLDGVQGDTWAEDAAFNTANKTLKIVDPALNLRGAVIDIASAFLNPSAAGLVGLGLFIGAAAPASYTTSTGCVTRSSKNATGAGDYLHIAIDRKIYVEPGKGAWMLNAVAGGGGACSGRCKYL